MVRPSALAKSPLPSARTSISFVTPAALVQASMTKMSLTPVTAMASIPLPLMAAALARNPGRWL